MKLSQLPFSRPNALERSLRAEVENLRVGLESLPTEPGFLNEVALCLAYLSLGEHGRASLAFELVQEYRSQLDMASQELSAARKESSSPWCVASKSLRTSRQPATRCKAACNSTARTVTAPF
jgi:hypothetical protein